MGPTLGVTLLRTWRLKSTAVSKAGVDCTEEFCVFGMGSEKLDIVTDGLVQSMNASLQIESDV